MKTNLTLLLLVALLTGCRQQPETTTADLLEPAPAETQGMSEDRLGRIDSMLRQAVANEEIPGAVALIARNGKVVMHTAYGLADTPAGVAFEEDDIFRIASQTKAITATAVMMLWEEGRFQLDDAISDYIPAFAETGIMETFNEADSSFTTSALEAPITIRHLLTHTSGIGYGMIDGDPRFRKAFAKAGIIDAFTSDPVTLADNIPKLARMPLHHKPGEGWTYSEGLDVLGYLVEIVSGMPYDQFLKTRIFDPLGMADTWFYLPEDRADRLVPVQYWEDGAWRPFSTEAFEINYPITGAQTYFAGGAGLSSTAMDYARFLQMYLNQGEYNGQRLLSRTTVEIMMANQIGDLWAGGPKDYGLAFGVVNTDGIAHGGEGGPGTFDWGGYFNTQYFADPGEQLIGILMKQTQAAGSDETGWKFRQMVFAAIAD
ncbi:serine hydrolase [Robiginitalea sp. SC105]|uniref:serine hydrolase domain-containing protein n=1 Tax=Robiginitalea sp. SC105 TaxID=2762332 RepID=UPI001639ED4B|nr:serine hydrolase domain-containing protein [Robiginitalea sp. SC105]MBC2838500.1 beta-lactamase family protein [Robiginitalea sp. SC105]